ncbi:TetR/AcrR family transcriptional regulator [Clostridium botulinum]|nr:TetR/AcrR family transcriptional regulator [Clostridium botulinum]
MMALKKSDITRQYIIYSAIETITKEGIEKASINKILKDAKVSKGSFYYYFEGFDSLMDAILLEVTNYYFEDFIFNLNNKDDLKNIGKKLINNINDNPKMASILFLFISKVFTSHRLKERVVELRKKTIESNDKEMKQESEIIFDKRFINLYDILVIGFISQTQFVNDSKELVEIWNELVEKLV